MRCEYIQFLHLQNNKLASAISVPFFSFFNFIKVGR